MRAGLGTYSGDIYGNLSILNYEASLTFDCREINIRAGKEAGGSCLLSRLNGVQVVGGSNPLTPISVSSMLANIFGFNCSWCEEVIKTLSRCFLKSGHYMPVSVQCNPDT